MKESAPVPEYQAGFLAATGRVKLTRGMDALLHTHPFHGHVAAGWRARPDPTVGTMGVVWACGGV